MMERIVHSQIQDYFDCNGLNTRFQHAYRRDYSTCSALTEMTDDWFKEMDNSMMTGAVLLDFSAAFDVIDHDFLFGKLKCYGFSPTAILFMKSYLSNGTQRVRLQRAELWGPTGELPRTTLVFHLHKRPAICCLKSYCTNVCG